MIKTNPKNIQNIGPNIPSTEFSVRLSVLDLKRCSFEDELTSLLTISWTLAFNTFSFWSLISWFSIRFAISRTFSENTIVNTKSSTIKKNQNSDIVDQLNSLNELYKSGVLTKEEFEKAKKKILN